MMSKIEFKFELDKQYMKHLKDISCYNSNYYELDFKYYGDYILGGKCNILYQKCDDDCYGYYCTLGYFENGEFVECFTWFNEDDNF